MVRYPNEALYIAGPECFYINGYDLWWSYRKLAEFYGIPVVLPTSTQLKLNDKDLKNNAKEIFDDLIVQVSKTTSIIADLEFFRGSEPDGGTIFELGWIYSKGGRLYGYTRDKRSMAEKNQGASLSKERVVLDQFGKALTYPNLPFSPSIIASTKVIEGSFKDALKLYLLDLEEESMGIKNRRSICPEAKKVEKRIYFANTQRYFDSYDEYKARITKLCNEKGYEAVFPIKEDVTSSNPLKSAKENFDENMKNLISSSLVIADLNDFHGLEPNNDVSFECGVAYGKGIKCYAFMADTRIMRERIPHYGDDKENRDWAGNDVENFNLPINLMFSTYFDIIQGDETQIFDIIK